MSDLSWLYNAIDGRGKSSPDATVFYGTMGSCADELKAVILAGQELIDESSFFYGNMRAALAALAEKGPKT